ncbi:MAG: hypothetical protein Q9225_007850 [Loekoesia sp. 1 TL-2023]
MEPSNNSEEPSSTTTVTDEEQEQDQPAATTTLTFNAARPNITKLGNASVFDMYIPCIQIRFFAGSPRRQPEVDVHCEKVARLTKRITSRLLKILVPNLVKLDKFEKAGTASLSDLEQKAKWFDAARDACFIANKMAERGQKIAACPSVSKAIKFKDDDWRLLNIGDYEIEIIENLPQGEDIKDIPDKVLEGLKAITTTDATEKDAGAANQETQAADEAKGPSENSSDHMQHKVDVSSSVEAAAVANHLNEID